MKSNMLIGLFAAICAMFLSCNEGETIPEFTPTPEVKVDDGAGTQFTEEQLALPKKKGACFTLKDNNYTQNYARISALNVGWNYSWGHAMTEEKWALQPAGVEFVPMAWGGFTPTTFLSDVMPLVLDGSFKRFLGFNEPDGAKQANMTVEKAIQLWPTLMRLGIPLGSPAPVDAANGQWLESFMSEVDRLGYRVDYICVHNYPGTSVENFKNKMTAIHNKYHRPLLITEFAPADWNAETVAQNKNKPAAVLSFMKGVLDWMEETDFIYGYAWFSFDPTSAVGGTSALFNADGSLTDLGKYYAAYEPGSTPGPGPGPGPEPGDDYGPNLVVNGDFEITEPRGSGWARAQGANNNNYDLDNGNIINGHCTLRFSGKTAWADNSQVVTVEPGAKYLFGMTGRILDANGPSGGASSGHTLTLAIRSKEKVGDNFVTYGSVSITEGTDKQVSDTVTIPDGVNEVTVFLSKANGIAFMDDIFLKKVLK